METIHVCFNVADAEEAIAFYEQLGFEETRSFATPGGSLTNPYVPDPHGGATNYYMADDNGMELQLKEREGLTEFEQGTAWDHIAIGVDDVDRVFESLDHYGVLDEPRDLPEAGTRIAFVKDPDDRIVELVQRLDE